VYSAIKIIAKVPDLYSVLNPETNSDSPSAKSKGVRLVSASIETNHIKKIIGIDNQIKLNEDILCNIKVFIKITGDNRIRDILTS
jgi:hypothetical protein